MIMKSDIIVAIEQEQYALMYYLEHGNPGPVIGQIAVERIKTLELKKQKFNPLKYTGAEYNPPKLILDRVLTVGDLKF